MEPIIHIPLSVLARLVASHSLLSEAEYKRNPSYNDEHYSHKAEATVENFINNAIDGEEEHVRFWERVEFFMIDHP